MLTFFVLDSQYHFYLYEICECNNYTYPTVSNMSREVYCINYEIEGTLSAIAPSLLQIIDDFKNATQVKESAKVHVSVIMTKI